MKIRDIRLRKILATNAKQTIEVEVETAKGKSRYGVPMGTSTGNYEAKYMPLDYLPERMQAIRSEFITKSFHNQEEVDAELRRLDGTENFGVIGGNLALGVSAAFLKAFALESDVPVFK